MRVTFLGNAPWSVPPLETLAGSSHGVRVVTRAPRPAGRGGRLRPTPVADAARRLGLPVAEVETVRTGPGLDALVESPPDVLAVVAYGEILPAEVLAIPRVVPVNLHFSLLPELRGAAPVQRAILEGLTATGVTTIRMDQGMDTGPILLQAEEHVRDDDDSGSLGARLAAIGGRLLVDTLDRLEAGTVVEHPQDDERATYAPKLTRDDEVIDWSESADRVVDRIRALSPEPGARTMFRGRVLKVRRAEWRSLGEPGGEPTGSLTMVEELPAAYAGSEGVVVLQEVQLEGKRSISGAEFVRGYRPAPEERLG
ncbi:MAG TPA: methionyl-tRNA formyltransferase [Actinomycetota bacterium]|nr:methionyl-tRNA formyltransferase [Actinomycetota bacterium]